MKSPMSIENIKARIAALQSQLDAEFEKSITITFPHRHQISVSRQKIDNWTDADEIGLSPEASRNFSYSALEVMLDVEIYEDGSGVILGIAGVPLEKPVKL